MAIFTGMLSRCLILVLFTALAAQAFAQTAFAPVADKIRAEPLALLAAAEVITLTPADPDTPRQEFSLRRTFAADGSFITDWTSPRFTWHERFRADGTLLASRQTDGLKSLVLEQATDPGRTSLHTVLTEKGQVKSDKTAELTPGTVLRDEMTHLVAQAWRHGIRDGLTVRSLSPDGAMAGDFLIQFRAVNDPTSVSSKYAYPDEFKAAVAAPGPYLVADMSLQGIAAVFVPYHFYLVYAVTASGLEWRAYFGEDPKKPVYRFLKR